MAPAVDKLFSFWAAFVCIFLVLSGERLHHNTHNYASFLLATFISVQHVSTAVGLRDLMPSSMRMAVVSSAITYSFMPFLLSGWVNGGLSYIFREERLAGLSVGEDFALRGVVPLSAIGDLIDQRIPHVTDSVRYVVQSAACYLVYAEIFYPLAFHRWPYLFMSTLQPWSRTVLYCTAISLCCLTTFGLRFAWLKLASAKIPNSPNSRKAALSAAINVNRPI